MFKFNIGDVVKTTHPILGEWVGRVLTRTNVEDGVNEYLTENAPLLLKYGLRFPCLSWEEEMELVK